MPFIAPLVAAAAPVLETAAAAISVANGIKQLTNQPKPPPVLSQAEAVNQAKASLDPIYNQEMNTLNQALVNRGFFGQLPGAAQSQDLAARKAAAIAQLADQMQGRSFDQAAQISQQAQQQAALGANTALSGVKTLADIYNNTNWSGVQQSISGALQNIANGFTGGGSSGMASTSPSFRLDAGLSPSPSSNFGIGKTSKYLIQ